MQNRIVMLITMAAMLGAETINWPAFRGVEAQGIADGKAVTSWNADSSEGALRNVVWNTAIPGLAHSSPAIWGNKIFVTSAVSAAGTAPLRVGLYGDGDSADDNGEQSWVVYCLDKTTGKILWQRVATKNAPKTKRHTKATHANATPVTDGQRVVVFFGSEGVYSYDLDGKLLWKKDLGTFDVGPSGYDLQWGTASSPVLFEDKLVLQCDQKVGSFLIVLSAKDGRELWRTSREGTSSQNWATPAVVKAAGRTQVICNGWPYIASYDFTTGKELWRLKSGGDIPVPTPVFSNGIIYVTNAHGGPTPLYAIKPEASGDISPDASGKSSGLVWYEAKNGAYMQTPLIVGGLVYSCSDRGILKVFDAKTGEQKYTQRLSQGTNGFSASPIAVDSKIYFTSEEGEVFVIKAGPTYELLSKNLLGEIAMASPAYSEDILYYRTRGHVIAIGSAKNSK
jgi:outer membrane protein assembly factor BamB